MKPMETQGMMLHLDVANGCTAESLIGALAGLVGDITCIKQALMACDLPCDGVELRIEANKHTKMSSVASPFSENKPIFSTALQQSLGCHKKVWDRRRDKETAQAEYLPSDALLTFGQLAEKVAESGLHPITQALALKAIQTLADALEEATGLSENHFSDKEGQRILFEVVSFCTLLHALDPSAVTATRVAMSLAPDQDTTHTTSWLLTLSQDIPTLDRSWPAPYSDCVGLALLKTVVSRFGSRSETIVACHSTGADGRTPTPLAISRALLCYPTPIASRPDTSPIAPDNMPNFAITTMLGQGTDLNALLNRLHNIGIRNVSTWQTFENSALPRMMLRVVAPFVTTQTIVEALLITGEATEVSTHAVETETLEKRTVSVPFGRGQKMQACRVNEWLWCGKVLRADPDPGDLQLLVNSTGFAQDVVRADVLAAWRRWRAN